MTGEEISKEERSGEEINLGWCGMKVTDNY